MLTLLLFIWALLVTYQFQRTLDRANAQRENLLEIQRMSLEKLIEIREEMRINPK